MSGADNDTLIHGYQSVGCHYTPNAFPMSVLLFIGTFLISYHLKNFKTQNFFPAKVTEAGVNLISLEPFYPSVSVRCAR